MQSMTKDISRKTIAGLLTGLMVLSFLVFIVSRDKPGLVSFRTDGGWGYKVSVNREVLIYQPCIPAIEGNRPFASRHDAMKTGRLARRKICKGIIPLISIEELKEAGVKM